MVAETQTSKICRLEWWRSSRSCTCAQLHFAVVVGDCLCTTIASVVSCMYICSHYSVVINDINYKFNTLLLVLIYCYYNCDQQHVYDILLRLCINIIRLTYKIYKINLLINPLECKGNCSTIWNNMKLVHWLLIIGLLTYGTVRRGLGLVRVTQPAQGPPHCTECNSQPINGQYCCSAVLICPLTG